MRVMADRSGRVFWGRFDRGVFLGLRVASLVAEAGWSEEGFPRHAEFKTARQSRSGPRRAESA